MRRWQCLAAQGGLEGKTDAHTQASGAGKEQLLVDEEEVNNPWLQEAFHTLPSPRPN